MKLKEIKEAFDVSPVNNGYILWSKTEKGNRFVKKYCGFINKRLYVDGYTPVKTLNQLLDQLKQYEQSLPYDLEYYYPGYREGIFEEFIIHDYMNSIGFNNITNQGDSMQYTLTRNNIYGGKENIRLEILGLSSFSINETISVILFIDNYSWVNLKCNREVEPIKNAINSLLKPLYLTDAVLNLNLAEQLKTSVEDLTINKLNGLNVQSIKFNLKEKLQEIIDLIKD